MKKWGMGGRVGKGKMRKHKQDMNFKTTQDIFVLLCRLLELDTPATF